MAVTEKIENAGIHEFGGTQALRWRIFMATVVVQTRRLSRFFGRVGLRFYEARLAMFEREVEWHRRFLGTPKL